MSKTGTRIIESTGSVIRHRPEYRTFYGKKSAEPQTHQHKQALALASHKFICLFFNLLRLALCMKIFSKYLLTISQIPYFYLYASIIIDSSKFHDLFLLVRSPPTINLSLNSFCSVNNFIFSTASLISPF